MSNIHTFEARRRQLEQSLASETQSSDLLKAKWESFLPGGSAHNSLTRSRSERSPSESSSTDTSISGSRVSSNHSQFSRSRSPSSDSSISCSSTSSTHNRLPRSGTPHSDATSSVEGRDASPTPTSSDSEDGDIAEMIVGALLRLFANK